jgi:hypothetical protein
VTALYIISAILYVLVGFFFSALAYGETQRPGKTCGIKALDAAFALMLFGVLWPIGAAFFLLGYLGTMWIDFSKKLRDRK